MFQKKSPFLKKKEAKSREVKIIERFPTPFPFSYLIQNTVVEALSEFGKQNWVILSRPPLLPPPSAPENNMVNKYLKFVPKHTCVSVCLQKTDISFVMGVCVSVQIRSTMEKVLVRGSQRQNPSSGDWPRLADRTSSIDGFLGITKCTQNLSHALFLKPGVSFPGVLFSLVVVMYVIWVQAMADLENYTNMKRMDCPDFTVHVRYGWSFMLAPIGVFFALLAGMLFLLVGRAIYLHSD